ncbi:MAG: hypothetical protein ICV74_00645 [Thermoleophilia bacterium]|nr:hypothetical protein [Thermoleophilia bacterium]
MRASELRRILEGAVDLHVHPAPSPLPRRIDAAEAARLAGEAGFRAIVVKSHHHSTVMDVLALASEGLLPSDVAVFGGIALNGPVGGLNPKAVDLALKMGGKIVWFPTIGSPQHIRHHAEHPDLKFPKLAVNLKPEEPIDILADGRVRDEVYEILESAKAADAVVAGGHLAPDRITALFEAAREVGVTRLLVNHPNFVVGASYEDARRWVALGAFIEHSLCMYDDASSFHHWDVETLVAWIEAVGPERSLLGSDLGQMDNPLPTDSFRKIAAALLDRGLGEDALRALVSRNAAELVGVA